MIRDYGYSQMNFRGEIVTLSLSKGARGGFHPGFFELCTWPIPLLHPNLH